MEWPCWNAQLHNPPAHLRHTITRMRGVGSNAESKATGALLPGRPSTALHSTRFACRCRSAQTIWKGGLAAVDVRLAHLKRMWRPEGRAHARDRPRFVNP